MSRTTVVIDMQLLHTAMRIHGFKTRREAVDFALRKLVEEPNTRKATDDGGSAGRFGETVQGLTRDQLLFGGP